MPSDSDEPVMSSDISDRIYGCLIGGAIGDALAAPIEGWSYDRIRREYGTVDDFKPYYMPFANTEPGSVTSDTALRQYLSLAIVKHGRRIGPTEFSEVLQEHLNPNRVWVNDEIIVKKLSAGISPWDSGRGAVQDSKILSAVTPIGIINAFDPDQAYQDAFLIASVFHDDFHRDAAGIVAAGVARACEPDATLEDVLEVMMDQSSSVLYRAIDIGLHLSSRSESVNEFVSEYYDRHLDWRWPAVHWDREKFEEGEIFSASAVEIIPVAMAILSLCSGDVNRSIVESANFGRDSDAIASLAGGISGTLHGAGKIRQSWIDDCEAANREFFEELEDDPEANFKSMADRLEVVLHNERNALERRAEDLDDLLSPE